MGYSWDCRLCFAVVTILITTSSITADTCSDAQRLKGPLIKPCKNEIILKMGQNFTITCKGRSKVQFIQQEKPEELTGPFNVITTDNNITDEDYKYETTIDMYNINQFAIGYYACYDDTVDNDTISLLNYLTEEPNNSEHVSYIYVYVDGTDSLFAPMREVFLPRGQWYIIECRPSTPDIRVTLSSDNKSVSAKFSPKIGFTLGKCGRFAYKCLGETVMDNQNETKTIRRIPPPPKPTIAKSEHNEYFLEGESFTINCTLSYNSSILVNLVWETPLNAEVHYESNGINVRDGQNLYSNLTVYNATKNHAGVYKCLAKNNCDENTATFTKTYLDKPFLDIEDMNKNGVSKQQTIVVTFSIQSYPEATFEYMRNGKALPKQGDKYKQFLSKAGDAKLQIFQAKAEDTGYYLINVTNGYLTRTARHYVKKVERPRIIFNNNNTTVVRGSSIHLVCDAIGYPLPVISWAFRSRESNITDPGIAKNVTDYQVVGKLTIPEIQTSGNITCSAKNSEGVSDPVSRQILVYELYGGFGIKNSDRTWFSENDDVSITCVASKYEYSNLTWSSDKVDFSENGEQIIYHTNELSHTAKLKMDHILTNHTGTYICQAWTFQGNLKETRITITVEGIRPVVINVPETDTAVEVRRGDSLQIICQAEGVPPPQIQWRKDGNDLKNDPENQNLKIITDVTDHIYINSTLVIDRSTEEDKGEYECFAESPNGSALKAYTVSFEETTNIKTMLSVILVIIFVLIVVVAYLIYKIRKEKQFRRELQAAGLLYFKEGVTKSINPELGIDEQAELLPYDEKFEFPPEKLVFGIQLGAGAFGVVYKAEARGIINAEETTEVAVKMVKKNADNMFIKALASELKIMVHMGKHINIVNLLGACTKNVGKRELLVIVEYCKFGNIHKYMQRHREVFIDQLTDNKEQSLGRVNRGFSTSSGSTGIHSADYFGSTTQNTDHTFVNTANTNRSTRKEQPNHQKELVRVSEGYVQPEWRSNYETEYSDGRNPRPLTSRDLLVWAFQIARGMEYLASRKVLHGDLAARNVLLCEDNIVKICDFGLARSIYKNDEYQKKEHELLPVKWLALECMTDRIFSTQSDVWAFGIVLWELFSLAQTPYPNVSPASLIQWLADGKRLSKPPYADDRLHNLMLRCWQQKPTQRPTFSELQETLGGFLEDNVRNHYVDLNSAYMDANPKQADEDYLAMMCAPDYNNLVTPSPHHYVNETSFFPTTPSQIDEEGYLQMSPAKQSIFSPRAQDPKFDFDARKFNTRASDASSCGSELTPMLTLNNLPARSGSESDHEGNASPYLNTCPRIEEETDDVFETKHNNAKNVQNTAVTNPTYITLDIDIEKKPKDIITNTYLNVPNGLVK